MHCDRCQEIVSARLDGEATALESDAADRHLARCAPCASEAAALARSSATNARGDARRLAPPADLTARVFERVAWSPGSEVPDWARYGLLLVALTEVVLALPQLFVAGHGVFVHDQHHLAAWDLAFGIGLVVVAWQPERARGLLPMAAALACGMALTATVDMLDHTIPAADEVHHVFDFAGVALLWVVGRSFRIRPVGGTGESEDSGPVPLRRTA
jgi:predicted anti-sigma-YlaC factor YlaD